MDDLGYAADVRPAQRAHGPDVSTARGEPAAEERGDERANSLSNLAPLVSTVCLNEDTVALHLLVKLGRYHEAATAYAAQRSLLLSVRHPDKSSSSSSVAVEARGERGWFSG